MGVFSRHSAKLLESEANITADARSRSNNGSSYELKNRIHRVLIERVDLSKIEIGRASCRERV